MSDAKVAPEPALDFSGFLISLGTSALINLGEMPDPDTHQLHQDLEAARNTIDILGLLEEKTRNNLSDDEGALLQKLLFDLRIAYARARGVV
jgi:hypothetical protein